MLISKRLKVKNVSIFIQNNWCMIVDEEIYIFGNNGDGVQMIYECSFGRKNKNFRIKWFQLGLWFMSIIQIRTDKMNTVEWMNKSSFLIFSSLIGFNINVHDKNILYLKIFSAIFIAFNQNLISIFSSQTIYIGQEWKDFSVANFVYFCEIHRFSLFKKKSRL